MRENEFWACVIFYNDTPELLEKCLSAIKKNNLKLITIDGAFKEFLVNDQSGLLKPFSTDGTIEIAKKYSDIFVEAPPEGWENQAQKRNKYVELVPTDSYFIIIDADEILTPFISYADLSQDIYRIVEHRYTAENVFTSMSTIRVYKKYNHLRYMHQHCRIYDMRFIKEFDIEAGLLVSAKNPENQKKQFLVDCYGERVEIHHLKYSRSPERLGLKEAYYLKREEAEHGYIK